ncbi:MAG TPA: hypothetical protein VFD92_12105 [Candidatus Binatia bacterium]|nr:hypothetical protein [Candidatus Binatia bacterium]
MHSALGVRPDVKLHAEVAAAALRAVRPCFISGSSAPAAFFVDLGAPMIVASTIVPDFSSNRFSVRSPRTASKTACQSVLLQRVTRAQDRRTTSSASSTSAKRRIDSLS